MMVEKWKATVCWLKRFVFVGPREWLTRQFSFELFGRLVELRGKFRTVDQFLSSIERHAARPMLLPDRRCYPDPGGAQQLEFKAEEYVIFVDYIDEERSMCACEIAWRFCMINVKYGLNSIHGHQRKRCCVFPCVPAKR